MYDIKVKDVMTSLVVTMHPDDAIHEAAARLSRNRISGGPVLEDGKVVGVVSEADLIRAILPPVQVDRHDSVLDALALLFKAKPLTPGHGKTIGDVMSTIVVSVGPDESVWTAATLMDHRGVKRLPVVDHDGYLLGIISRADLVKVMARSDAEITSDIRSIVDMVGSENFVDLDIQVDDGVVRLSGTSDRSSSRDLLATLTSRVPGVVQVIDRMDFRLDDVRHPHQPVRIDPRENWNADIATAEGRR